MEFLPLLFACFVLTALCLITYWTTEKLWKNLTAISSENTAQLQGFELGTRIIRTRQNNLPQFMKIKVVKEGLLFQPALFSKKFKRISIPWNKIKTVKDNWLGSKFVEMEIQVHSPVYLQFKMKDYLDIQKAKELLQKQ